MEREQNKKLTIVRGIIGLLGIFLGLCTIFALVVTVIEAWQEHAQERWPEVTASIQGCDVKLANGNSRQTYGQRGGTFYIDCHIQYVLGAEQIASRVGSRSAGAPNLLNRQDPWGKVNEMDAWVDEHPQGTPITVRYDPGNHKKAVLIATDMPMGGPHTPANVKLLKGIAMGCVILLAIAAAMRPLTQAG